MKRYTSLVEGALFSAIFAMMLLFFSYIPLVGEIGVYFLPLPITVYAYRNKLRETIITVVVSISLSLIIAPPIAIINAIMASVMGATYGTVLRKGYSPFTCFGTITLVSALEFVLLELFAKTALGVPVITPFIEGVQSLFAIVLSHFPELTESKGFILFINSTIENLALGVFSVMGLFNALIVFSITATAFTRLQYKMVYLPKFNEGKNARKLLVAYWISVLLFVFGFKFLNDLKVITAILANFLFVSTIYYWIKGYMLSCEKIKMMRISPLMKALACLVVILIFLSPALLLLFSSL